MVGIGEKGGGGRGADCIEQSHIMALGDENTSCMLAPCRHGCTAMRDGSELANESGAYIKEPRAIQSLWGAGRRAFGVRTAVHRLVEIAQSHW